MVGRSSLIDTCEDCTKTKKLDFQLNGLELVVQKQKLEIESVQQTQNSKDIEHEQMIQNVTTWMDIMSQDLSEFKKEVKEDIQGVKEDLASIKKDIPDMFDNAVNKLLAKMFKGVAIAVAIFLGVVVLAFSRPVILKGIDEVRHWVENVEVKK